MTGPRRRFVGLSLLVAVGLTAAGCAGVGSDQEDGIDENPIGRADVRPPVNVETGVDVEIAADVTVTAPRPDVAVPDSWPSEIEALYGRYWLYWEAFGVAFGPPHADPDHQVLEGLSTERNWRSLQQQLNGFRSDRLVLVLPDQSVTSHLLRLPEATVLDDVDGTEVVLQDCWVDDFVQQTEDGIVVAETRESKLMNVTMKRERGVWRVDGVTRATADSDGFDQCARMVTS